MLDTTLIGIALIALGIGDKYLTIGTGAVLIVLGFLKVI
jgi:hypothetical protein